MKKQLRFCSATVTDEAIAECVQWHDGEVCVLSSFFFDEAPAHTVFTLTSYSSIVAFYDFNTNTIYLLPRWDYSRTTISHVQKFIEDYTNYSYPGVAAIRKGETNFVIADGYYDRYSEHLHKC